MRGCNVKPYTTRVLTIHCAEGKAFRRQCIFKNSAESQP